MDKKGIIFADMDGTLVFHKEIHGLKEMNKAGGDLVKVFDSSNGKEYIAHDISTNLYKVFLEVNTCKLAHKLKDKYYFVIVSGARKVTMDGRKDVMDFVDAYILENGGIILNENYSLDNEWSKKLDPEKPALEEVRKELTDKGWVMDNEGRTTALRVRKKDNPEKSSEEFKNLCKNLELPPQLKKTMNIGSLDIILASAGKGNAVDYLTKKLGFNSSNSVGLGDDINDLEMLTHTGHKYLLGNAYPEALEVAKKEGWYISKGHNFEGINEILILLDSLRIGD